MWIDWKLFDYTYDKMNSYCNDANDWLLLEYNLLEKQYKYYLNKLLQLENLNEKDIYIYKLNELIDFIKWVHYDKHDEVDESVKDNYDYYKVLRWNNINVNNTLNLDEEIKLINKDSKKMKFKEDYCLKEKDILLVCASINYLWKCAYIDKDSDYLFSWFLWVLRNNNKNNYISKLLYYYITSKYFKNYLDDNANWTTFNNLNNTLINNFKVRFPKSLDEQQHIVDILDKFSQLKNQLKNEIELRNKQYKFYLNKLSNDIIKTKWIEWIKLKDIVEVFYWWKYEKIEDGEYDVIWWWKWPSCKTNISNSNWWDFVTISIQWTAWLLQYHDKPKYLSNFVIWLRSKHKNITNKDLYIILQAKQNKINNLIHYLFIPKLLISDFLNITI